jgi:hypothetical protein
MSYSPSSSYNNALVSMLDLRLCSGIGGRIRKSSNDTLTFAEVEGLSIGRLAYCLRNFVSGIFKAL